MTNRIIARSLQTSALLLILSIPVSAPPMSTAQQEDEAGMEVHRKKCQMCHGPDGKGETKAGQMVQQARQT